MKVDPRSKRQDDSEREKGQEGGDDSEGESERKGNQKEKGAVVGLPADNPLYNLKPYMRKLGDWEQRLNRLEQKMTCLAFLLKVLLY